MSRTLTILAVIAVGGAIGAGGAYLFNVGPKDGQAVANSHDLSGQTTPTSKVQTYQRPARVNCREARLLEKDLRARWEPLWMQCDRLKTYDEQGYRRCIDVECKETCMVAKERQTALNTGIRSRVRSCAR